MLAKYHTGHKFDSQKLASTTKYLYWEYEKLKKESGLSDRDLNAAIGWLAREDKIDFDIDEKEDRLFLHVNVYIG